VELYELRALVKVVQTGSFTRAAEALNTQKAHVSRQIASLEKKLAVRLLERSTRSLSLTEIGREVFERAVGILGAVEDTERAAQHMQGEPFGVLRLTCGVEFGMAAVSGWIDAYLRRYPAVRVEADFTGRLVDLVHEGYDLAIRLGELPDSRLAARRLGELRYGLFASPDYLAQRGHPASPDALPGHNLLAFTGGRHRGAWLLQRGREEQRLDLAPRLGINNSYALREAAVQGLGIAPLPLMIAGSSIEEGRLQQVLPEWEPPRVPIHAVYPSSRYLTPKVRAFVDLAVVALFSAAN
jgi:DNA-binding transcriptional LysR family regulator